MRHKTTFKMMLSALFIAIGLILPFITMQVPAIGNMLLPMHIPILMTGFLCGWPYGLIVGAVVPLLRGALFGMPVLLPNGVTMAVELAVYGVVTGWIYPRLKSRMKSQIAAVYLSLIVAMIAGRIAWGLTAYVTYSILGNLFTWKIFLMGSFLNAIPGIIIQLIMIPILITRLQKMEEIRQLYEDGTNTI